MNQTTSRLSPSNDFPRFEATEIQQGIHQRFEKMAALYGDRLAVHEPERSLTYETLNKEANVIAQAILKQVSRGPGQVAFVLPNGPRAISTIFGILKAGKAYVPLDPLFPRERTAYMFEHSESTLILTDSAHCDLAREISKGSVPAVPLEQIDFTQPAENPNLESAPEALAYILFTSGSTGKPKAIAFGHRNLLHTTMCLINNLHISPEDRMTQLHSTSFAASVVDIYCSLLNGASVYPWDVKARGTSGLAKWLIGQAITCIQWIPTPFRQLVETLESGQYFRAVRVLVMASEPLTRREFDLYRRHFPDSCLLVNQMGTSESYNYFLFFANKETVFEGSIVPAGYPVSEDREVMLLDQNRKEVKPGEIGEIAIRSEHMSLGYWRNPELTAKAFLPDPEGTVKKVYLTGDIGRRLEDGCLLHLGRKDFQVKIRGYRIELPEVELALKSLNHIRDVVVVARHDAKGELKLVAYYITDLEQDLNVTELRRDLADKLPEYMIPNLYVRMREFPMTPSGKLDKNSLPTPNDSRPVVANELVMGRTEAEKAVTAIWKEVLGHKEIGVMDNFFELGGDSLQAALILHRANVEFGVDLGYAAFVRAPRIADMALLLERMQLNPVGQILPPIGYGRLRRRGGTFRGAFNRVLQVLALYAPGLTTVRPWLHRLRGVKIGHNVAIGTSSIIETARPELISIGDNVAIGIRNVIIGHFSNSIDKNLKPGDATVRIGDNVYIGACVTILPNVTIGEGAVVSAGSVVHRSVPPKTMVRGNPAVPVATCGLPLVGEGVTYEEFLKGLKPVSNGNPGECIDQSQRAGTAVPSQAPDSIAALR